MGEAPTDVSDEESRAAIGGFLQRSEVRRSTIHRVAARRSPRDRSPPDDPTPHPRGRGATAGGSSGGIVASALGVMAVGVWYLAVRGYGAGIHQTLGAARLTLRGRAAPSPSTEMKAERS